MKKLIQLLVFAALVTTLALPALAQGTTPNNSGAAASGAQDDPAVKAADYEKFTKNVKTDPPTAYEAGKAYLAKYAKDGPDDQYIKYITKWVNNYEKLARREQLFKQLQDKQVPEAFATAKQVLVDFPDDLAVLFELSRAGFTTATTGGNKALTPDVVNYTKKTIQLIQSNKSFDPAKPFTAQEKNDYIGGLNYALGLLLQESQPTEAVTYFINAAQGDGASKKDPNTYALLYQLYAKNDYGKLKADYEARCKTPEQLDGQDCKDLTTKINQVVDHMVDALARAIAYADTSAKAADYATYRKSWMDDLTGFYKYRNNNTDTGLKELLAGITSRPLPKPGEAVTPSLYPASAAPTTGTTTPSSSSTTTPASTTTAPAKAGTTGAATTSQPASKNTSSKTTPKRAHN
jgi:hypothetical protein